jgi:hypothetical protein
LTLLSVGAAQIGEYEFEVSDSQGTTRAKATLSVGSPLVVQPLPAVVQGQPRAQVQLEARVTSALADGVVRYQWRFNGVPIRGAVRPSLVLPAFFATQAGQYDVVVTNYLWRDLLPTLVDSVAPGGVLIYETFALGQASVGKPSRADFLLRPGELLAACTPLRVVAYEDGHECDHQGRPTRFLQRIAALRAAAAI